MTELTKAAAEGLARATAIHRHFVTLPDGRQVHYRRAGSGPAIVLCHESPLSSLSLVDLIEKLAERFTVVGLDNPGYGSSDQLGIEGPEIPDFADALAGTLDALGIHKAALYGAHTGAEIVLDFAVRYPQRTAGLVCDGLPIFSEADTAELLANYLPKWTPQWDGSHLLWAWTRYRDQHIFWPWYRKEAGTRMDADMASPQWLHEGVLDMLRAGDDFRIAYQAAFRYHADETVPRLTVPTAIVAREDDLLIEHLDLLPRPLPACVETRSLPRERPDWAAELLELYAAFPPGDVPPAPPAPAWVPERITRDYTDTASYGQLFTRRVGDGPGRTLVMLHASPASAEMLVPLQRRLGETGRRVIAFDTLGNGDSDKPQLGRDPAIEDYARIVGEALDALGLDEIDLYGSHTGAMIALELAIQQPERVRGLVLDGITMFGAEETADILANYTPPLEPRWDGGHLLWAWTFLKDQTLFWPWYNRTAEGVRDVEPTSAEALHTWVVELLKSGHTYPLGYRAAFQYPTRAKLPQLSVRTLICAQPGDMLQPFSEEGARLAQRARASGLPRDEAEAARAIAAFLDGGD